MEIRRVEKEMIAPPVASEQGARVEMDRRRQPDEHARGQHHPDESATKADEDALTTTTNATLYDQDAQLHEVTPQPDRPHIDFSA